MQTWQSDTVKSRTGSGARPPLITRSDLEYIPASLLMLGLQLIPPARRVAVIDRSSQIMGALWHKSNMQNVRMVRKNLRALGQPWSEIELESAVRRLLVLTAWNSMMVDLLPVLESEQARHLLPVEGTKHLDAGLRQGKGILLLGAHLGAFAYIVAAALYAQGYPISEVGYGGRPKLGSSLFYQCVYWPRVTAMRQHFNVIDPQEGPQRALLDALQGGRVLYLLPDEYFILTPGQSYSQYMVQVELFGRVVHVETGGIRLAKRLGVPVLTALPVQEENKGASSCPASRISIEPFSFPTQGTTPRDLARDMRAFLQLLEERVRAQPFLWRDLRRHDLFEKLQDPHAAPIQV